MSSTRHAKDDSIFHQCGYASSPLYERGLMSNLVIKRSAKLQRVDRELLLFVQYLSHQPGGLAAVAAGLREKFSDRLGTSAMLKIGKRAGQKYKASEVAEIRWEIPRQSRRNFPLRGETESLMGEMCDSLNDSRNRLAVERRQRLREMAAAGDYSGYRPASADSYAMLFDEKRPELEAKENEEAKKHPTGYPVEAFYEVCRETAESGCYDESGLSPLEKEISSLCVDVKYDPASGPLYFAGLTDALREYQRQWEKDKSETVVTNVGKKVCETLDATNQSGGLSLAIGNVSVGQYFAARAWCEKYPGRARCVSVPPSNDEASFYRAIARALGLGNFTNYKNVQIRERVECVLRSGDIMLVLNHAQNLWPQKNLREAFPGRLAWLLDMVEQGASACMISGPQFFMQKRACEKTGWDSPELREKIFPFENLPDSLAVPDLVAVARVMLPEASEKLLESVALYAFAEDHYLAGLERVAKRAKFLADRNQRTQPTAQDIVTALQFVSGSDNMLRNSLSQGKADPARIRPVAPAMPTQTEIDPPAARAQPGPRQPRQPRLVAALIRWNWSKPESCKPAPSKSF
jgi:hypothetical protein